MTIYIHIGPAAIRIGRCWLGVASGNRHCAKLHRTPARAIADARKLQIGGPQ